MIELIIKNALALLGWSNYQIKPVKVNKSIEQVAPNQLYVFDSYQGTGSVHSSTDVRKNGSEQVTLHRDFVEISDTCTAHGYKIENLERSTDA
ncbi:MAG: hypothetical protein AAF599_00025 [Bacteroidota bacterium]